MASVPLPDPVMRRPVTPLADAATLEQELRRRVDGEVRFDAGSRGAYSTDASNYRQVPIGVVVPRSVAAGQEAVAACRAHGAPVLSRGGGTSLAGQTCNTQWSSTGPSTATGWSRWTRPRGPAWSSPASCWTS
jgi:hypothetical protein